MSSRQNNSTFCSIQFMTSTNILAQLQLENRANACPACLPFIFQQDLLAVTWGMITFKYIYISEQYAFVLLNIWSQGCKKNRMNEVFVPDYKQIARFQFYSLFLNHFVGVYAFTFSKKPALWLNKAARLWLQIFFILSLSVQHQWSCVLSQCDYFRYYTD